MKKAEVTAIATREGCEANYNGKEKTMYIRGLRSHIVIEAIKVAAWNRPMGFQIKIDQS